jgi:hypothetical protein
MRDVDVLRPEHAGHAPGDGPQPEFGSGERGIAIAATRRLNVRYRQSRSDNTRNSRDRRLWNGGHHRRPQRIDRGVDSILHKDFRILFNFHG